jgi:hypothetical protein
LASSAEKPESRHPQAQLRVCFACGTPLRETLARLGSLRCLDCREANEPLRESLVHGWHSRGGPSGGGCPRNVHVTKNFAGYAWPVPNQCPNASRLDSLGI